MSEEHPVSGSADYRARIYEHYSSEYQDLGSAFDVAAADRWGRAYAYYLRGWLPQRKDAAVADLACGAGSLLHFFKSRGYDNLAGVDVSPDQVRLARQVLPNVHQGNVLEFLEQSGGAYDLITALDIIEHFRKDEALSFLDGCFAALKPGGRLILQTPNGDSPWSNAIRYGDFTHEVCFSPNSLLRLLRLCGFAEPQAREQGPVPWGYSLRSTSRYAVWGVIRCGLKIWNLAELGWSGSGVFTRVMLASGTRPP